MNNQSLIIVSDDNLDKKIIGGQPFPDDKPPQVAYEKTEKNFSLKVHIRAKIKAHNKGFVQKITISNEDKKGTIYLDAFTKRKNLEVFLKDCMPKALSDLSVRLINDSKTDVLLFSLTRPVL